MRLAFSFGLPLLVAACGAADPCKDDVGAFVAAQHFIRDSLRSPSTASFPSITASGNSSTPTFVGGRCGFRVQTYVDAENAFGATIRQRFTLDVVGESDNRWTLESIKQK